MIATEQLRRDLAEYKRLQTLGGPAPDFTHDWKNGTHEPPASASAEDAPPLHTEWGSDAHLRKG